MQTVQIKPFFARPDYDLAIALTQHDPNHDAWAAVDASRVNRKRGWQTPRYDMLPSVEVSA